MIKDKEYMALLIKDSDLSIFIYYLFIYFSYKKSYKKIKKNLIRVRCQSVIYNHWKRDDWKLINKPLEF